MIEQLTLETDTIQVRFDRFVREHPEVVTEMRRMCLDLVAQGHTRLSMKMIFEVARFRTMLGARPGEEPYRLNNVYTSRMARLLAESTPELAGVFETRALVS